MPLYRAEIFKQVAGAGNPWCNTYYVRATDLLDATGFVVNDLVDLDRVMHLDYVSYVRARVKAVTEDPPAPFSVTPLTGGGIRSSSSNTLPLWNVFRVDFTVFGGRPSRKLFRGPVLESDQNGGGIETTVRNQLQTDYADYAATNLFATATTTGLVDESNNLFDGCEVYPFVQMRQRHRKRRATSGGTPPLL